MSSDAGSKNPELSVNKITLSEHALKRVNERLGIKDTKTAVKTIRNTLKQAKRIGVVQDKKGEESVLYAYDGLAIYLTLDLTKVKTVIQRTELNYQPIREKVVELHKKELRKVERIEQMKKKRLRLEKLRINIELARLEYRKETTRSKNVKAQCDKEIKEYKSYIKSLESELDKISTQKKMIAHSLVSVI